MTMVIIYIISTLAIGLSLFAPHLADSLAVEDGKVETLTALFLFAASVSMLVHAVFLFKSRRVLLAVLSIIIALAFFVFSGEEISWGQRIFDIESSEFLEAHNEQGETNLHNIQTDLFNIVYHYGALVFLIILPLYKKQAAKLFEKLHVKVLTHFIPSAWVAIPSFTLLALLDPRFLFHTEKLYVTVAYLLALLIGLVVLAAQYMKATKGKDRKTLGLLSLSLALMLLGLIASSIYHDESLSPNMLAEYKELIIATGLFSFAFQLAHRTSKPVDAK